MQQLPVPSDVQLLYTTSSSQSFTLVQCSEPLLGASLKYRPHEKTVTIDCFTILDDRKPSFQVKFYNRVANNHLKTKVSHRCFACNVLKYKNRTRETNALLFRHSLLNRLLWHGNRSSCSTHRSICAKGPAEFGARITDAWESHRFHLKMFNRAMFITNKTATCCYRIMNVELRRVCIAKQWGSD